MAWRAIGPAFLAAAAAIAVYVPVTGHPFLGLDDPGYVFANERVREGLTADNVAWAVRATERANWHPVTWLSLMLDAELFGIDPGAFHRTNLAFHVLNVVLAYSFLHVWTGSIWRAGFVAALLAVHPIHVESVAWVSERKDVLSLCFGLLVLVAWHRYATHGSRAAYVGAAVAFAAGLASKPTLVTLPFVLLLLDAWPLGRSPFRRERWIEKLPLFALSAASCAITLAVQRPAMGDAVSLDVRLAHAAIAWVTYLRRAVAPYDLAIFHPYPEVVSARAGIAAALVLVVSTALALAARKRAPWCAVGWLWFSGTLVPMIGLVQVGGQATADRYAYLPFLGLYWMAAWGLGTVGQRSGRMRGASVAIALLALAALGTTARRQVETWGEPRRLFEQAIARGGPSAFAHFNLGLVHEDEGDLGRARRQYENALRLDPRHAGAHNNVGLLLERQGRHDDALAHYRAALEADPGHREAHWNLARRLDRAGDRPGATRHYRELLRIDPDHREAAAALATLEHPQRPPPP
jgi:hypothetical protein